MGAIQIRRRVAGPIAPVPTPTIEGELSFSVPGFTGGGPNALWMDTGTAVVPLVDRTRQVELAGAQTISGIKTVSGAGAVAFAGVANLTLADGTAGQVLTKGAGNALTWSDVAAGGVTSFNTRTGAVTMVAADVTGVGGLLLAGGTMTGPLLLAAAPAVPTEAATKQYVDDQIAASPVATDGVTIGGNGLMATPLALLPAIFGDGLTWTPSTVTLRQATQTATGGGMIATAALIAAGANDAALVSPLGLRSQLGADGATLVTTAKTVIPALNEIYNTIAQLTGVVIFAGTYDATTSTGTYNGQGGIAPGTGPLPAAAAANGGAYLIVTVAGPGGGAGEPAGAIAVGDWLQSNGTAWTRLAFNQADVTAPNVALSPTIGAMGANVQTALEWVETGMLKLAGGTMTGPIVFSGLAALYSEPSAGAPPGAPIRIRTGANTGTGDGGVVEIEGGRSVTGVGGRINITGGTSDALGGPLVFSAGSGAGADGQGGFARLVGGNSTGTKPAGDVTIQGGMAADGAGGDVWVTPGNSTGLSAYGKVRIQFLPDVPQYDALDPSSVSILWNNNGVLNIGAGGAGSASLPLAGGVMTGPINMAAGSTGVNLLDGTDLFVMGAANGANFVAPTLLNTAFGTWATQNIGFGIDDSVSPPRLRWKANGIDLGVIASGIVGDYLPLTGGTMTGNLVLDPAASVRGVDAVTTGNGGDLNLIGGTGSPAGRGGNVSIDAGRTRFGSDQNGGNIAISASYGHGTGRGGNVTIWGGNDDEGSASSGGYVNVLAGWTSSPTALVAASVLVRAGGTDARAGETRGGTVTIEGGLVNGSTTAVGGDVEILPGHNATSPAFTPFGNLIMRVPVQADNGALPIGAVWQDATGVLHIVPGLPKATVTAQERQPDTIH
jgi:hypothetical protein